MALTEQATRAAQSYVDEIIPRTKDGKRDNARAALNDAWLRGFEGRPLRRATGNPEWLAWSAGQRFPGAVAYVAPDACAEPPKPGRKQPCRNCKPGKQCADCRDQTSLDLSA